MSDSTRLPRATGEETLWRVDLHIHTRFSPDSATEPAALIARARQLGLARIAITDHDTIDGALAAQQLAPDLVIVGEEIRTAAGGELIAYFVQETVPPGLPLREAIRRLRGQAAVISVSHPLDRLRNSALGERLTREIIEEVDALEGFNARCLLPRDNRAAARLAGQYGKALTAGSDAHTLGEVGAGYLLAPPFADSPDALRASLTQAQVAGRWTGPWPHFASTLARLRGA
jgi:predicted metal-dependent phosphoesterase TrpH